MSSVIKKKVYILKTERLKQSCILKVTYNFNNLCTYICPTYIKNASLGENVIKLNWFRLILASFIFRKAKITNIPNKPKSVCFQLEHKTFRKYCD